jgi:glycerol-3-phosphate dehydrogenase
MDRDEPVRFRELDDEGRALLIASDPRYGHVLCRCERVTEGEIVDAVRRPAGARDLDAVKRRTRAGMGRCQSGFCLPRVLEVLSRELAAEEAELTKKGPGSPLVEGRIR